MIHHRIRVPYVCKPARVTREEEGREEEALWTVRPSVFPGGNARCKVVLDMGKTNKKFIPQLLEEVMYLFLLCSLPC